MTILEIYEDLGVEPIINVFGPCTALSGALIEPEVADTMAQARQEAVRMDQLQGMAGRIIAEITGAESAYVTAGAAASLTLGTAACLTGLDIDRMEKLPDTTEMPNEVIIARDQRNGYDHAIRAAGARLIEVGMNETHYMSARRVTEAHDYEAAITDRTAAIAYFYWPGTASLFPEVINVAKKHGIPLLVDAAEQVPPVENLRKFTRMGADLVAISGGKSIGGPKSSGILCGRRDLIAAAALQNLDLAIDTFDTFNPPPSLIRKEDLKGLPHNGIGRGLQVGKEEIVGLVTALWLFTKERCIEKSRQGRELLKLIISRLKDIPHVELEIVAGATEENFSTLRVKLNELALGRTAFEVYRELIDGDPSIYTDYTLLSEGVLLINPFTLNEQRAGIVAQRLREVITGH